MVGGGTTVAAQNCSIWDLVLTRELDRGEVESACARRLSARPMTEGLLYFCWAFRCGLLSLLV